jgi:hypothetical protein
LKFQNELLTKRYVGILLKPNSRRDSLNGDPSEGVQMAAILSLLRSYLFKLTIKYRTHLQDKSRDPVFHAAAMAGTHFAITFITYDLTCLNFYKPVAIIKH